MERNATRYAWMVFDFYICTTINYFKNKVNIIAVLNHRDWELKRRRIRRVSAKHFQFWKKILLKKKSTKLNSNYLTKLIKNHVFVLFYFFQLQKSCLLAIVYSSCASSSRKKKVNYSNSKTNNFDKWVFYRLITIFDRWDLWPAGDMHKLVSKIGDFTSVHIKMMFA